MDNILLSPPVAFGIVFVFVAVLSRIFSRCAFRNTKKPEDAGTSYACGESNYDNTAQPDYSHFFSFAFLFTVAHVAALMLTTVPKATTSILITAGVYLVTVIVGLAIFLRR